ncbi:hypothetical protein ACRALDRAFT_2130128 [Sodiomyces alcalophilus JCM 7366]|uniref:uncharacterized protein n=1 Tax=Sodiomyces alcalophilus JCM 7366 TaxID=591952 RepID=UPI0039B5F44A
MKLPSSLTSPPPPVPDVLLSFPIPHVLVITLNRPSRLNSMPKALHAALLALYEWYDAQPHLRVAILTGTGRAFCAGADLKEWHTNNDPTASSSSSSPLPSSSASSEKWPARGGFGGLSNRRGKKPVIVAVNGLCLGGGFEMVANADLVYALSTATFGLPEVTRGVVAIAGALPRLVRILGRQRATEMTLLGDTNYTAEQMRAWGLVNGVVEGSDPQKLMDVVLGVAAKLAGNAPDAVVVSREGLMSGLEPEDPQEATIRVEAGIYREMEGGENMMEGVQSFVERRKPIWKDSKL